ncbi:MAG: hypothetical protein Q8N26_21735 [Myxococcales bacterium]|nr:hypothetical protein [Myxococcales bacterium]
MTTRLTLVMAVFFALACSKGQAALTDDDKAGEVFTIGAKVKAPLGKRKKQSATVTELYGKVAKLHFSGGDVGWALVKDIEPVGAIQQYPKGDSCSFEVGDEVLAHWSTSRTLTAATIDEVHGKLAHLKFIDNDVDWAVCSELKPKAHENEADSDSAHEGGGVSAEVTKCQRGCNHQCQHASNKSKCVGECRRACRR